MGVSSTHSAAPLKTGRGTSHDSLHPSQHLRDAPSLFQLRLYCGKLAGHLLQLCLFKPRCSLDGLAFSHRIMQLLTHKLNLLI